MLNFSKQTQQGDGPSLARLSSQEPNQKEVGMVCWTRIQGNINGYPFPCLLLPVLPFPTPLQFVTLIPTFPLFEICSDDRFHVGPYNELRVKVMIILHLCYPHPLSGLCTASGQ